MKHFNDLYDLIVKILGFLFDKWKIMAGKYVLAWTVMLAAFKFALVSGTLMATMVLWKVGINIVMKELNASGFLTSAQAMGQSFTFTGLLGWFISTTQLDKSLNLVISALTTKFIISLLPFKR